jgi:hypothetical protein
VDDDRVGAYQLRPRPGVRIRWLPKGSLTRGRVGRCFGWAHGLKLSVSAILSGFQNPREFNECLQKNQSCSSVELALAGSATPDQRGNASAGHNVRALPWSDIKAETLRPLRAKVSQRSVDVAGTDLNND